jgi:hypothetical protein
MIESQLSQRLRADKRLAKYLEEGYKAASAQGYPTLKHLYSGLERLSWYASCSFEKYQNVCMQLHHEDLRALQNIQNQIARKEAILQIFQFFFEKLTRYLNLKPYLGFYRYRKEEDVRKVIEAILGTK